MAFNGSGTFSTLATLSSGATITAAEHNSERANIKGGLELARLRDGQNNPSANLPMATFRHTGVGDSQARTDYASTVDIQDGQLTYAAGTGTDTVTATIAPAITAYATGQSFWIKQATTNTGAMTVNLNSIGGKALKKQNDVAMAAGDIEGGQIYQITYDGTDFQMQSQIANSTADATLNSIADLGTAADKMAYTTGVDTWAETAITSAGRALLDDAAASNQRTTLGLAIGTDVQAQGAVLDDLNTLGAASTDGEFLVATGSGAFAYESGATARASMGVALSETYTSSAQTITAAGALTLAHSLSSTPYLIFLYLKNVTTEANYSADDEVLLGPFPQSADDGVSIVPDGTNINVRFGSSAATFAIPDKTSGAQTTLTNSKWKLVVRAWA